jgi:isocitrate dehydrogenase
MGADDFRSNEQSITMEADDELRIELVTGTDVVTLKASVPVRAGEIVDGTFMSKRALVEFLGEQVAGANELGVLFSLHLKATIP